MSCIYYFFRTVLSGNTKELQHQVFSAQKFVLFFKITSAVSFLKGWWLLSKLLCHFVVLYVRALYSDL